MVKADKNIISKLKTQTVYPKQRLVIQGGFEIGYGDNVDFKEFEEEKDINEQSDFFEMQFSNSEAREYCEAGYDYDSWDDPAIMPTRCWDNDEFMGCFVPTSRHIQIVSDNSVSLVTDYPIEQIELDSASAAGKQTEMERTIRYYLEAVASGTLDAKDTKQGAKYLLDMIGEYAWDKQWGVED